MKKKFPIWIVFIVSIITVGSKINAIFSERSRTNNLQLTTLAQNVSLPKDSNFQELIKGQSLNFEFRASDNNLGTVEFLFNNHERINKDTLTFRIKEKGSSLWYYQSKHETSKMDSGQYYPFGFPVISDSKNKIYDIEVESLNGKTEDSVSLNPESNYFQAKYSYPKGYLLKNPKDVPHFILAKLSNYLSYFQAKDLTSLFAILVMTFVVFIPIIIFSPIFQRPLKETLYANANMYILLFIYAITHIPFIEYSQYWDSLWYWHLLIWGMGDFKATSLKLAEIVKSFIDNFNFLGHPSMGYTGVISISQFIDMENVVLLNIENVILAMLAIWAFYRIVTYFFPERKLENTLITAIFAFNPLFYATSISFNLDFGVLVFEVLMIEALIYKKFKWFLLWSIMLIFSKEIGILIYLSLFISYLVLYVFKRWWNGDRKIFMSRICAWLLPLIIFGIYLIYSKGNVWSSTAVMNTGNTNSFNWNDNGIFTFGINSTNIATRFFHIFIMNFGWIMTFVITAIWLKAQVYRESILKHLSDKKKDWVRIFSFILIVFVTFNFIYIVMPFPRYVVASIPFLILVFYFSLNSLLNKKTFIRGVFLLGLLILNFIQVFRAIDPSPRILFGTNYLGKNASSPIFGFNDGLVYNSQFVMVDKLAEMIKDYSKNGPGIILDKGATYFFKDVSNVGNIEDLDKLKKEGVTKLTYAHIPWFTTSDDWLTEIQKTYQIKDTKTFEYDGYYVEIYDLEAN